MGGRFGEPVETHDVTDDEPSLGKFSGLVLVALLIGAVLWVAFAPYQAVDRGSTAKNSQVQGSMPIMEVPAQIDVTIPR